MSPEQALEVVDVAVNVSRRIRVLKAVEDVALVTLPADTPGLLDVQGRLREKGKLLRKANRIWRPPWTEFTLGPIDAQNGRYGWVPNVRFDQLPRQKQRPYSGRPAFRRPSMYRSRSALSR